METFAGSGAVGCRVCGVPLRIVQRHRGLCDDPECRRRDVAYQAERRREAVVAAARARVARAGADVEGLPVLVLPGRLPHLVPLETSRREAFTRHLDAVLEQAAAEWTPLLPPRDETNPATNGLPDEDAGLPILAEACGFCGGQCCESGGDTAWIEVATIQRILPADEEEPDFQALRTAYLDRLPATTHAGSCVFHAEHGCALPRDMRSRVCNRFACTGLARLAEAWKSSAHRTLLLANDTRPTPAIALAEGNRITPLNPTP